MYIILLYLLVVLVLWGFQGQRTSIRRHGRRLPRPPGTLPFVGNGIWFLQPRHRLLDWFVQCERQSDLSTFEISVPSLPPGVVINDPKNVEHVLKNDELFIKGSFFRSRSWDLFGNGIINADGDLWKIQRKAGLRFFSNANLKEFIDQILPPYLHDLEEQLDAIARSSGVVDLQELFLELTTRLMGQMAYDMDIPASLPFSKAFDFASGAIAERFQNPFWKVKEFLFGASLRKAISEVKLFSTTIVAAAVQKRQNRLEPKEEPVASSIKPIPQSNLIDSLLDHINDHQVVADAAMNYLSAGRDTTAQSLTWTFHLLNHHAPILHTLLAELTSPPPLPKSRLRTFDSTLPPNLPYTTAVFHESLRIYPPVPIEIKECTAATTFPDGTFLPKGALVMWIPWAMGRSRKIWGPDADQFRPERWLQTGVDPIEPVSASDTAAPAKLLSKTAFEFPVFNGGARACLGKKMAEVLAVAVIARLVERYEFAETVDKGKGMVEEPGGGERVSQSSLTLPMKGGLPCFVRRRDSLSDGQNRGSRN